MNVSIYEAKTHFSALIGKVEQGQELIICRRQQPVAKIVPLRSSKTQRIGALSGRPFQMGENFDTDRSELLGDLFGVASGEKS